jgi:hypothetical protein
LKKKNWLGLFLKYLLKRLKLKKSGSTARTPCRRRTASCSASSCPSRTRTRTGSRTRMRRPSCRRRRRRRALDQFLSVDATAATTMNSRNNRHLHVGPVAKAYMGALRHGRGSILRSRTTPVKGFHHPLSHHKRFQMKTAGGPIS